MTVLPAVDHGARRYAEPVHVRCRDGVPEQFLWRRRLYLVQTVLAHWRRAGRWWLAPAAVALLAGDDSSESVTTPVGIDDREREVWRVEAATGRAGPRGSYDLCLDRSSGSWSVTRVHD